MKGLLYYENYHLDSEERDTSTTHFFCAEHVGRKLHVSQTWSPFYGVSVRVMGPCDGSCTREVELEKNIIDEMNDFLAEEEGLRIESRHFVESCDDDSWEAPEMTFAEKFVTKINRWTTRYRWTRGRRLVADYS